MKLRILTIAAMALVTFSATSPEAQAQFGGDRIKRPLNRPTVSPYLNLFRGNNSRSPILNYYNAVRPQQQFYRQDQKLSQDLKQVEERNSNNRNRFGSNDSKNSFRRYRMSITGHRTGFMTIGGSGGAGGGDEGGGAGGGRGDDDQSSGNRFSGHSASFGSGSFGGPQQ